jgi:carboxylate-amine ligase
MPDADTCLNVLETVLPWLPVVLALSANSPYLAGAETGLASNRAEVLAQLPRSGAPPRFESFAQWKRFVDRFTALGVAPDYTALWWDVRAHPRFGTLELRVPDQPTSVELSGAFVALLQALCASALDRPAPANQPGERAVYQQNRWAAARFGPRAQLIHPYADRLAGVDDLAAELLQLVGPFADGLGSAALLAPLDPSACEGDRQLEVARAHGLAAGCVDIVERSLASP